MTLYYVWSPDQGGKQEYSKRIDAIDEEHAAELWAEWEDSHSAEYTIVSGEEVTVCVVEDGQDEVRTYVVIGESVPRYFATEKALTGEIDER